MGIYTCLYQPKAKTNWVIFLSDSLNLNSQLRSELYPIPKINEILLKLEGFRYTTSLHLNMGYYHTCLGKETSNLCTILLPWGRYRYKHLPMGVGNSPNILQEKICRMFRVFDFIQVYTNNLLIIIKADRDNHFKILKTNTIKS